MGTTRGAPPPSAAASTTATTAAARDTDVRASRSLTRATTDAERDGGVLRATECDRAVAVVAVGDGLSVPAGSYAPTAPAVDGPRVSPRAAAATADSALAAVTAAAAGLTAADVAAVDVGHAAACARGCGAGGDAAAARARFAPVAQAAVYAAAPPLRGESGDLLGEKDAIDIRSRPRLAGAAGPGLDGRPSAAAVVVVSPAAPLAARWTVGEKEDALPPPAGRPPGARGSGSGAGEAVRGGCRSAWALGCGGET